MVTPDHTAEPSGRYRVIGSSSPRRPCWDSRTIAAAVNCLLSEPTAYTVLSVAGHAVLQVGKTVTAGHEHAVAAQDSDRDSGDSLARQFGLNESVHRIGDGASLCSRFPDAEEQEDE